MTVFGSIAYVELDLNETFFDTALVVPSHNSRKRWVAIGVDSRGVIVVVFAKLGAEGVSIISMRPASRNERKLHAERQKEPAYSKRYLGDVSDTPEFTVADFAQARPFSEAFPDLAASIRKGRGPNKASTKKLVSLRLSPGVIDYFKATGAGWQSRIGETLRNAVKRKSS